MKELEKPQISVAIEHFIHLTREQRYALHSGEPVNVVGHSVPVWNKKGKTSEPAREVFCNYALHNDKGMSLAIKKNQDGYQINLPQLPPNYVKPPVIADELWRMWKPEDKEKYWKKFKVPLSSVSLLDIKDGGSAVMGFGQVERANVKGSPVNVVHLVRIATVESLVESLV